MNLNDVEDLIAPLMPKVVELPLTVSDANRQLHAIAEQTNSEALSSHLFPWNGLIILAILVMLYLALTHTPQRIVRKERTEAITKEALAIFATAQDRNSYLSLEQKIKELLQRHLTEGIETKTTEEIASLLSHSTTLDTETQKLIRTYLQKGDLVKYAHLNPSGRDWKRAQSSFVALTKTKV